MSRFKSGDIVVLRSGNNPPEMTVKETHNGEDKSNELHVICTWFDNNKVCEHTFREEQLKFKESIDFSKIGKE